METSSLREGFVTPRVALASAKGTDHGSVIKRGWCRRQRWIVLFFPLFPPMASLIFLPYTLSSSYGRGKPQGWLSKVPYAASWTPFSLVSLQFVPPTRSTLIFIRFVRSSLYYNEHKVRSGSLFFNHDATVLDNLLILKGLRDISDWVPGFFNWSRHVTIDTQIVRMLRKYNHAYIDSYWYVDFWTIWIIILDDKLSKVLLLSRGIVR